MINLPRITVVTPSYNQAEFLERTICSVLDQDYPNLEYIIIDGGSSDGSVEIIKKYESRLDYWISEPDRGQSHAINKGLKRATGEWVAWQNSDDIYYQSAFLNVAKAIKKFPTSDLVIGDINLINENDDVIRDIRYVRPTKMAMLAEGMVLANQAAFWRRSLHEKVGLMDQSLHYGFDYEWFLRLLNVTLHTTHLPIILGALRYHSDTKTSNHQMLFDAEFEKILEGRVCPEWKKYYYQFRRVLLTIAAGHYLYVYNGIKRRLTLSFKKLIVW